MTPVILGRALLVALIVAAFGAGPALFAQEEGEKAKSSAAAAGEEGQESAAGHHDPYDIGHGNAGSEQKNPTEIRFDLALWTFVVFLLLVALLGKFAWGPISQGLDKREQNIANMIADAERNQKEAELRLRELEARLAAQAEEAREALSAARREGELVKEKIVGEAHAAAQQEKERALVEIRNAKNVALREIAQKSVNTAVDLATNIIRREVKPDDHAQLISDSLAQFQSNN